jgi:hypothetical protein
VTGHALVDHGGDVYVIGGTREPGRPLPLGMTHVYHSRVGPGTSLDWEDWKKTVAPPSPWYNLSAVNYDRYIIAAGGRLGSTATARVMVAELATDGSITQWKMAQEQLPEALDGPSLAIYFPYLFALGGNSTRCYVTDLPPTSSDPKLSTPWPGASKWRECRKLPAPGVNRRGAAAAFGYLYYVGVRNSQTMYRALINLDGSLGPWEPEPQHLSHVGNGPLLLHRQGELWVMGGEETGSGAPVLDTHGARFDSLGHLGRWARGVALPYWRKGMDAVVSCNFLLLVGGTRAADAPFTGSETVYAKTYR